MTALTEFLFPAPAAERSPKAVVAWWESRRLAYNAFVGTAGTLSLFVLYFMSWLPPGPHQLEMPWIAPIVFGVAANVCYCLGPLVELLISTVFGRRVLPSGPTLYRMGLTFSVGLALLPILISWFDYFIRVLKFLL